MIIPYVLTYLEMKLSIRFLTLEQRSLEELEQLELYPASEINFSKSNWLNLRKRSRKGNAEQTLPGFAKDVESATDFMIISIPASCRHPRLFSAGFQSLPF